MGSVLSLIITNPGKLFKPRKPKGWSVSEVSKLFSGLHTLVIREYNSGSVVSDMTLYYAQYNHTRPW